MSHYPLIDAILIFPFQHTVVRRASLDPCAIQSGVISMAVSVFRHIKGIRASQYFRLIS